MRTFAPKPKQPHARQSLNFAPSGVGKQALKAASAVGSAAAPATMALAHDFSRISIHAQEPTTVSDEATAPVAGSSLQGDCPPGKAWVAGQHLPPLFPRPNINRNRSNTSASSTVPDPLPTVSGRAVVDCKDKVWRYQLDQFVSNVDINIYYFTEDHYPAPTPADDSGELTNVTRKNCKGMVEELHTDKAKVHRNWSAYMRDHLHEGYHYEVEWMDAMNKFVPEFESAVEELSVPFASAQTEAEAQKILDPPVQNVHATWYAKEWRRWKKIPDVTEAGAYLAQVPAIEYVIDRVVKYGKAQKWLPANYTPGDGALEKGGGKEKGEEKVDQPGE